MDAPRGGRSSRFSSVGLPLELLIVKSAAHDGCPPCDSGPPKSIGPQWSEQEEINFRWAPYIPLTHIATRDSDLENVRYWSCGRYGELYPYFHSGDSLLSEHAATTDPGMPPKRARRTVAAADAARGYMRIVRAKRRGYRQK